MQLGKLLTSLAMVSFMAGCSFTGDTSAPIQEGSTYSTIYKVQAGDTLYSIARRYGIDPKAVARENGLSNPNQLRVGQQLRLSVGSGRMIAHAPSSKPRAEASETKTAPSEPKEKEVTVPPARSLDTTAKVTGGTGSGAFVWPVSGNIIKSFGANNKGVDIAGKEGDPVVASADGKVIVVGNMTNLGNLVIVQHNSTYVTAYCHLKNIKVKQGNVVKKGQTIATIGKTDEQPPRVHFEIRKLGKPLDPTTMLPKK